MYCKGWTNSRNQGYGKKGKLTKTNEEIVMQNEKNDNVKFENQ